MSDQAGNEKANKFLSDNSAQKNKEWMTKHPILTGILVIFIIIFCVNLFGGSSDPKPGVEDAATIASKETAQKELDELIDISKQAGLVTSYEFSNSAAEVYVGKMWYTQTVQFKKNFMAKVGMLEKSITGYSHFVVKDAYSNEKVAEITAFSKSIEIYK